MTDDTSGETPAETPAKGKAVKKRMLIRKRGEHEEEIDLTKYGARRQARIYAMQSLFQYDICEEKPTVEELTRFDFEQKRIRPAIREFATALVTGALAELPVIDPVIVKHSTNWNIERIGYIERAILRFSIYSMFFQPDVPRSVIIDEAIEIAKVFGGKDTYKFVNGILDGIDRDKRE